MPLRHLFNWIFYGHVWIALGATGLSWMTLQVIYSQDCVDEKPVLAFIFLATLGVYTLHRYLSFQRAGTRPTARRYELVKEYPTASLAIGGGSILIAGVIGISFISSTWRSLLWALPLTVFYLTPPVKGWQRLRDLPYVKVTWVALAWTIITCNLPVAVIDDALQSYFSKNRPGLFPPFIPCSPRPILTSEIIFRFFFTLSIALLFDFRDTVLDQSQRVKTVANQYPLLAKLIVSITMLACCVAVFMSYDYTSLIAWPYALSFGLTILVCWATNEQRSENWFATVVNGMLVLLPVLVGLAYYYDWYLTGSLGL